MTTFEECVIESYRTGSRYICSPPVLTTDRDTVILVNGYHDWESILFVDGWELCGDYQGGDFSAYRKGEDNYIVTENPDYFLSYVKATEGAAVLNLQKKEDRIALFNAILTAESGVKGLVRWEGVRAVPANPVPVELGAVDFMQDDFGNVAVPNNGEFVADNVWDELLRPVQPIRWVDLPRFDVALPDNPFNEDVL